MKTLILSKYKGKNNVQDNLTDLVKRYGRVFHIKYKTFPNLTLNLHFHNCLSLRNNILNLLRHWQKHPPKY